MNAHSNLTQQANIFANVSRYGRPFLDTDPVANKPFFIMAFSVLIWGVRHWVWSNWLTLRHNLNRPLAIGPPPKKKRNIQTVTFRQKFKQLIPLDIPVYTKLPPEENKITVRFVHNTTLFLNRVFPARQDNLPEINEDINVALNKTLTSNYRRAFRAPKLPKSLDGDDTPNIEELAVTLSTCSASHTKVSWTALKK